MNKKSLVELLVQTFFLFTFLNSYTQVRTHTLSKISPSKIKIDGIITEEEIEESKIFNLDIINIIEAIKIVLIENRTNAVVQSKSISKV